MLGIIFNLIFYSYIRFYAKQFMNLLLILCGLVFVFGSSLAFAEKGTYLDKIQFIQYSDENTALEEVKNGNLDIYYWPIPFDRITDPQSREGLKTFPSTGQSYSLLVNPAPAEKFNPFSIKDVRFALNYLVDRNLIVDELLGGYGVPMVSAYKPYDPDYLLILGNLESKDNQDHMVCMLRPSVRHNRQEARQQSDFYLPNN